MSSNSRETFPLAAGVSLVTGRLVGEFSEMHRLIEYLAGRPVFTHEMASKRLWDDLSSKMLKSAGHDFAVACVNAMRRFDGAADVHAVAESLTLEMSGQTVTVGRE